MNDKELDELLLSAYYRGKDEEGYSDFQLRQDKRTIQSLLKQAELRARIDELKVLRKRLPINLEKLVYEMWGFEEYIDIRKSELKAETREK